MEKVKVSIITINYNNKEGLKKTIKTVRDQTYEKIEYIIIDGGSTDGGREIIKQNEDIITFWVSEPDKGIYDAMNKGVAQVSGDYCIFMNSGDCFPQEDTISKIVSKARGADIIYGKTILTNGEIICPFPEITMAELFEHALYHQSCLIDSVLMKKYGYDISLKIVSDRKFFLQALILDNCSYEAVDIPVAVYDIDGFSSHNPVASRLEYAEVLEELIPKRIRLDYGRTLKGALYGDTDYDKLFSEIRIRKYRKLIYSLTVFLLSVIAKFKKSAAFVYDFPKSIK